MTDTAPVAEPHDGPFRRGRRASGRESFADVLEQLGDYTKHLELIASRMTEVAVLTRGLVINDVMWSGPVLLDANGHWTHSFQAPFAAVMVLNMNAGDTVVVTNAGIAGAAPGPGPGSFSCPPNAFARRNIAGREITIYGVAGITVEIEVLVRPVEPLVSSA